MHAHSCVHVIDVFSLRVSSSSSVQNHHDVLRPLTATLTPNSHSDLSLIVTMANTASTRARLTKAWRKPRSRADGKGFINAYEAQGKCFRLITSCPLQWSVAGHAGGFIHVKVGRTGNVRRRLQEWKRSCPSSSPRILGYVRANDVHKLERLVHIELEARSVWRQGRGEHHDRCADCKYRLSTRTAAVD